MVMSGMEELVETIVGEERKAEVRDKVQEMRTTEIELVQKEMVLMSKQTKILKKTNKLQDEYIQHMQQVLKGKIKSKGDESMETSEEGDDNMEEEESGDDDGSDEDDDSGEGDDGADEEDGMEYEDDVEEEDSVDEEESGEDEDSMEEEDTEEEEDTVKEEDSMEVLKVAQVKYTRKKKQFEEELGVLEKDKKKVKDELVAVKKVLYYLYHELKVIKAEEKSFRKSKERGV